MIRQLLHGLSMASPPGTWALPYWMMRTTIGNWILPGFFARTVMLSQIITTYIPKTSNFDPADISSGQSRKPKALNT